MTIALHEEKTKIRVETHALRLHLHTPVADWDGQSLLNMTIMVKGPARETTDPISYEGKGLIIRGNLENIPYNMLKGGPNTVNVETNLVMKRAINTK